MSGERELRDRLESLQVQARDARRRVEEAVDAQALALEYQGRFEAIEAERAELEPRRAALRETVRTLEAQLGEAVSKTHDQVSDETSNHPRGRDLIAHAQRTRADGVNPSGGAGVIGLGLGAGLVLLVWSQLRYHPIADQMIAAVILTLLAIPLVLRRAYLSGLGK